jgi:transcriptional antiterminator RfaH
VRQWYCVYTKPRQSDLVCRRLEQLPDIEVLNPKLKRRRFIRGRWIETVEDFFPCYIFLRLDINRYYRTVKYTRGVRRFVGDSSGIPYVVDLSIIESIKERMVEGFVEIGPSELRPGDRVVIREGPLSGFEGIFLKELKPKERVLILLNTIQYKAKVEIEKVFLYKQD